MGTSLSETKSLEKNYSRLFVFLAVNVKQEPHPSGGNISPLRLKHGDYVLNGSPCIESGWCVPRKTSSWQQRRHLPFSLPLLSEKRKNKMLI